MIITGEIADFLITKVDIEAFKSYKLPQAQVPSVKLKFKEEEYTVKFPTKEDHEAFLEKYNNESPDFLAYSVTLFDGEGNIEGGKIFFTEENAKTFISETKETEVEKVNVAKHEMVDAIGEQFEKYKKVTDNSIGDKNVTLIQTNNNIKIVKDDEDDEDDGIRQMDYVDIGELIEKTEKATVEKARGLLMSAAKFYLQRDITDETEFVAFKLKVEQGTLVDILIQMEITKKVVMNLANTVINGKPNAKLTESLTSAQRLIFDFNKFQLEFIRDLQKSLKELRTDEESEAFAFVRENPESQKQISESTGMIGEGYQTNDRVELIKELNKFLESNKTKTPASVNAKLNDPNDKELGEPLKIKGDDVLGDGETTDGSGLDSFE